MTKIISPFILLFFIWVNINALGQSPCYFILLGSNTEGERVRVHAPFQTNLPEGNSLGWTITGLTPQGELFSSSRVDLEIKTNTSKEFKKVKLRIPRPYGCHLLVVRDLKLKPPHYFRAEWLSQEMMDEYFFPGSYNGFDTTLFFKKYKNSFTPPTINMVYKEQPFTAELLRSINPFNGQNLELKLDIISANDTEFDAKLKAVEISFIHPNLMNVESKYILSRPTSTWPENDSRFYWPNDFTMVQGAKIIFKFLYWYKDGYEIKESGIITRTIEF
jgi:hypothetical protein